MAKPKAITVKVKADTTELIAAFEKAEARVEKLYAKIAKVRRAGRSEGKAGAATRETR